MCVDDDDDDIEEVSAAARVRLPQQTVVVDSDDVTKKGVNSGRLAEKMEEQLAAPAVTHRQPHLAPQQKMNGGISDISECEEEVTAEAPVRTVSPLRSGVSAAETKAHSPTRTYKLRSPERGRKTAVDATVNGVQPTTVERSASREKTAGELQTPAAPAVFVSHHEDPVSQQPPLKRRKRTKTNNKSSPGHEEDEAQSDGESNTAVMATGTAAATAVGENADATTAKSPLDHLIPTDMRFDPKSLENKPKGLVDALSNFFTPGLKRTSRTAMNSLLKPEIRSVAGDASTTTAAAASGKSNNPDVSASAELTKKVRLSVDEKEARETGVGVSDLVGGGEAADRKRHASAGQQQVKSLYDGLSHLYSDCDSRLRSVPTTNYNEKARTAASGAGEAGNALTASSAAGGVDNATAASAELLKAGKSPERISSPHRMSDAELKEKEKATGTAEGMMTKTKTEGEKEEKGTSKRTCLHATERRKIVLAVWAFVYVGFALVLVLT